MRLAYPTLIGALAFHPDQGARLPLWSRRSPPVDLEIVRPTI